MSNPPEPPPAPAPGPPPAPAPPPPPAPAPPPPAPAPEPSNGVLDTLMNTVQALTEQVAKLQPNDSRPVPRPWTHWGSKR